MRAVTGWGAEARVYLWHCLSVVRPGIDVPVFATLVVFDGDVAQLTDDDLTIVVDEGRRQLDRQQADLERVRSRAATLVTVALVEIALLSSGARRAFADGAWATAGWGAAALLVLLGLAGAPRF